MNILITGVKGVIGKLLEKELISLGHYVIGVDLLHGPGEIGFSQIMGWADKSSTYIRCDIANYRQLERIFNTHSIDLVYNCAAECGRWSGEDYYEQLWKTNMIGTKNLLELQRIFKYKLVHFSTSEIYGNTEEIMIESLSETINPDLMNDYAISKWANEKQIKNAYRLYGNEVVIIRPFNTYGIGEFYHPYRSVNVKLCYYSLHNLPITIYKGSF
jgi:dTDP-glucose 4,6-dehydratase